MLSAFEEPIWKQTKRKVHNIHLVDTVDTKKIFPGTEIKQEDSIPLAEPEYSGVHSHVKQVFLGRTVSFGDAVCAIENLRLKFEKSLPKTKIDVRVTVNSFLLHSQTSEVTKGTVVLCEKMIPVIPLFQSDVVVHLSCSDPTVFDTTRLLLTKIFWSKDLIEKQRAQTRFYVSEWDMHVVNGMPVLARLSLKQSEDK